jgi:hypothetical protein
MDYHLHLYEPDVDRNGFDIVAEDDDDQVGWFQTKAVLASAKTASWKFGVDFLRPAQIACEAYRWDLPEAGRGGGVILIEIKEEDVSGSVTYRYTDFDILAALAEGLLRQQPRRGRGKRAKSAQLKAAEIIAALRTSSRNKVIVLPANVFVTVQSPDDLLGLMKMRSELGYGTFAVRDAYRSIDASHQPASTAASRVRCCRRRGSSALPTWPTRKQRAPCSPSISPPVNGWPELKSVQTHLNVWNWVFAAATKLASINDVAVVTSLGPTQT